MNPTLRKYRALIQRLEHLREYELQSMATSLQESVGRDLTEITTGLWALRQEPGIAPNHRDMIDCFSAVAERAREALRRLAFAMRPPGIDDLGLAPALERCIADFSAITGTATSMLLSDRLPSLSRKKGVILHGALEEALANIASHARAHHVEVQLSVEGEYVLLQVRDDGVGTTDRDRQKPGALGLFALNERLVECGGALSIKAAAASGTVFEATLPVANSGKRAVNSPGSIRTLRTEAEPTSAPPTTKTAAG